MPFARWENFRECELEMIDTGHDEESAKKICGAIQERAEKGELYKAIETKLNLLSKAEDTDIILGGYASWDLVDPERDIITVEAQTKGLQRFLKQPPEYQSITINHKEFKLAQPMLKYTDPQNKTYYTHVNEKGTYLISKLRNDNLKTTKIYREKARKGELTHYSISGIPLTPPKIVKAADGLDARRIDDIEYWAITLCEKDVVEAVNPKAIVSVIKKNKKPDLSIEEILAKHGFNKSIKKS